MPSSRWLPALMLLLCVRTASAQDPRVDIDGRNFRARHVAGALRVGALTIDAVPTGTPRVETAGPVTALFVGDQAFLLGRRGARPQLLWRGQTAYVGDRGERRRDVLSVADRTGDGVPDAIVGHQVEGQSLCGQEPALLEPRAFDPASGELRPVELRRLDSQGATGLRVEAAPLHEGSPLAPLLTPRGASSGALPFAAVDGNDETAWTEAVAGSGRWEFVTFRVADGAELAALRVVFRGTVRNFWLVGENGTFRVEPPSDGPVWVRAPIEGACLSLVLDGGSDNGALAELTAFGDIDFGGGLQRLLGELAAGPRRQQAAADLLVRAGARAVEPLMAAFPQMPTRERVAAARILARLPADAAAESLAQVLRQAPAVRESVLSELETRHRSAMLQQTLETTQANDPEADALIGAAALSLARLDGPGALPALLGRYEAGFGGAELASATRRAASPQLGPWFASAPPAAVARVALAVATSEADLSNALRRAPEADDFDSKLRFLRAQRRRALDPSLTGWVEAQLDADEWMLRAEAIRVLGTEPVVRRGLADDVPRVRLAAVEALAVRREPWAVAPLRAIVREERWAFVRAAALRALGAERSRRDIAYGLADRHERVRAAAVEVLLDHSEDRELRAAVIARMSDRDEWPIVTRAAVALASRSNDRVWVPGLIRLVERSLEPTPYEPDVEVAALAVTELRRLGGDDANGAVERARRSGPPAVRIAAEGGPGGRSPEATPEPTPES